VVIELLPALEISIYGPEAIAETGKTTLWVGRDRRARRMGWTASRDCGIPTIYRNGSYRGGFGRGCGVGRDLGVGVGLGVALGVGVGVGVALGVGVGVGP